MAYVYRHIRHDKGTPFYIGVGAEGDGKYKRAKAKDGRNKIWKDITSKSGFTVEIIFDNISFEESRVIEIDLISIYGKIKDGGMLSNLTDGGEGWLGLRHSEDSKKKMSDRLKGRVAHNKGKISEIRGEKHGMWGKKHTEYAKMKMQPYSFKKGRQPWNKGISCPVPHLKEITDALKSKVYQYDLDGIFISSYESLNEAARKTSARKGNISHCLQGNRNTSGGFLWKLTPPESH